MDQSTYFFTQRRQLYDNTISSLIYETELQRMGSAVLFNVLFILIV